jgi:hypothetical protein
LLGVYTQKCYTGLYGSSIFNVVRIDLSEYNLSISPGASAHAFVFALRIALG